MKKIVGYCLAAAYMLTGQISHAKNKPVHERGWIGGTYDCVHSQYSLTERFFGAYHTSYAFPPALAKTQGTGLLALSLGTNTPAYLAGVREGDLILTLDNHPVTTWTAFNQTVATCQPGASLVVKVWHSDKPVECRVTVGREKFKDLGYFTIFLPGYLGSFHPIPTAESPCFSLMALGLERPAGRPVEFASVKDQYEHNCHPKQKQTGYDTDLRFWLAIFELKKGKEILAQETVPAKG